MYGRASFKNNLIKATLNMMFSKKKKKKIKSQKNDSIGLKLKT